MKRSPRQPRTASKLCQSTQQLLNSYALAASAAGVGMLALTLPAEAKIVYTPTHHIIKKGISYHLDLSHDGKTDFALERRAAQTPRLRLSSFPPNPLLGTG